MNKYFLLFINKMVLLLLLSSYNSTQGGQNSFLTNQENYNTNDIRFGDYIIRNDSKQSDAVDELIVINKLLLQLKTINIPIGNRTNVEYLKLLFSTISVEYNYGGGTTGTVIFGKSEQLFIDSLVFVNYDSLNRIGDLNQKLFIKYLSAHYLFSKNKDKEARQILEEIISNNQGSVYEAKAELDLSFRDFNSAKYDDTQKRVERIIKQYPNTRVAQDALYLSARTLFIKKKYKLAKQNFDDFLYRYPLSKWNEGASYFRAKANELITNTDAALAQFESFISKYPKSIYKDDARESIANCYERKSDLKKAIKVFETYKLENPEVLHQMAAERKILKYYYLLKLKAMNIKEKKAEYIYYDSLLQLYPGKIISYIEQYPGDNAVFAEGYFALSQYYQQKEVDYKKALNCLDKINDPRYLAKRGQKKGTRGCNDCNYGLIEEKDLLYNYAQIYLKMENYKEFEKIKQKIIEMNDPLQISMLETLIASNLLNHNQKEEAIEIYQGIYSNKNAPEFYRAMSLYMIGTIYQTQNIEWKSIFNILIREFPENEFSKAAMKKISEIKREKRER